MSYCLLPPWTAAAKDAGRPDFADNQRARVVEATIKVIQNAAIPLVRGKLARPRPTVSIPSARQTIGGNYQDRVEGTMTDLVLHHLGRRYALTTDRAESSYGMPVLVDENGQASGPLDVVDGIFAADLVRAAAARDLSIGVGHPLVQRFLAPVRGRWET